MLQPGHVIDVYDDAAAEHLKDGSLLQKYGAALEIHASEDLIKLPDRDFALVIMTKTGEKVRKYPVHTPDALAVSTHYFEKLAGELPKQAAIIAAQRIKQAHLRFGAEPPAFEEFDTKDQVVGPYFDAFGNHANNKATIQIMEKKANHEDYAFRRVLDDGKVVLAFPMRPETIKDALLHFKKIAFEMPARDRYLTVVKLSQYLKKHGIKDEFVEKMAAFEPNPAFMTHMQARKEALLNLKDRATLDSLSKIAASLPPPMRAAAIEEFDRSTGLHHYWDRRIRNPWDSCFTIKEASVKVGDKTITKKALENLIESGKLASIFKKSMVDEFKQAPLEVFESLPAPTKQTIAGMIE